MASITIRNLADDTKKRLRLRAAEHGRSLEAEVRDILDRTARAPKAAAPMNDLDLFRPIPDVSKNTAASNSTFRRVHRCAIRNLAV